jgi:hypothetical protein
LSHKPLDDSYTVFYPTENMTVQPSFFNSAVLGPKLKQVMREADALSANILLGWLYEDEKRFNEAVYQRMSLLTDLIEAPPTLRFILLKTLHYLKSWDGLVPQLMWPDTFVDGIRSHMRDDLKRLWVDYADEGEDPQVSLNAKAKAHVERAQRSPAAIASAQAFETQGLAFLDAMAMPETTKRELYRQADKLLRFAYAHPMSTLVFKQTREALLKLLWYYRQYRDASDPQNGQRASFDVQGALKNYNIRRRFEEDQARLRTLVELNRAESAQASKASARSWIKENSGVLSQLRTLAL